MKHKYLPQLYGVVKDFHPRMIPENKVSDCLNVIFKQGRVRRRYGLATLGPDTLNGIVNGIAYYEQIRLGNKFTIVFTKRNAYLYNSSTGRLTPIAANYNTGTTTSTGLTVTGVGTSWSSAWTLLDLYQIKFGTNNADTTAINFTGNINYFIQRGSSLYCYGIASSSSGAKLAAAIYGSYIYTSVDFGETWVQRTGSGSRNWLKIASSSDGAKLVAAVSSEYIYTSTDSGRGAYRGICRCWILIRGASAS